MERPGQILDGDNASTLNEEERPTQEADILAWRDLDLQAQDLIFSTTETGCLISFFNRFVAVTSVNLFISQHRSSKNPVGLHVFLYDVDSFDSTI